MARRKRERNQTVNLKRLIHVVCNPCQSSPPLTILVYYYLFDVFYIFIKCYCQISFNLILSMLKISENSVPGMSPFKKTKLLIISNTDYNVWAKQFIDYSRTRCWREVNKQNR